MIFQTMIFNPDKGFFSLMLWRLLYGGDLAVIAVIYGNPSATLALGVYMHFACVADPQLWFLIHLHQTHIRFPHVMHVR